MPDPLYLARCAWIESRGAVGFDETGCCIACAKPVHAVGCRAEFAALVSEPGAICVRVRKREVTGASGWLRAAAVAAALPLALGCGPGTAAHPEPAHQATQAAGDGAASDADALDGEMPPASRLSPPPPYLDSMDGEWIGIIVEEMPELIGGIEALRAQVRYPEGTDSLEVEGRVYVSFDVSKTGAVENVRVVRGLHPVLDAEAIRVVRYHAKFLPATQRGKPIATRLSMPIEFRR